ncbi:MAG TPA: hypothetical protein VFG14_11320 [Chthoniobacteraceae bacterium]|nr:hypothetical protein [Chthoniobacteraceae bacterium]
MLLPTVLTCTAAAAADVAEAIPRFGWVIGVVFAILVLMGTLITLADLVPHLIKWLRSGHARFSAMLARAGNGLDKFADRITDIISDR